MSSAPDSLYRPTRRLATAERSSAVRAVPVAVADSTSSSAWLRRLFDLSFSLTAIVLTVPLFLLIGIAVGISSRGPILYAHPRVGRNGQSFPCLKFRTMREDADDRLAALLRDRPDLAEEFERTQKLRADPRVTPLGRLLRRSSLDELPQFLNVVLGHMSVVGPRPVTEEELVHYGPHIGEVLAVRPGITGSWQVSGRSDTTYAERVSLDLAYVRTRTFGTDVAIIVRTVRQLLSIQGNGAY